MPVLDTPVDPVWSSSPSRRRRRAVSPAVAVVVLNYQHGDDTLRCLRSVQRSTFLDAHPIVIDNGSAPEVLDGLRRGLDPTVEIVATGENLGYAGGNNVGVRRALDLGAELVWILNPDTTVEPDALEWLVRTARSNPDVGIVGSRVFHGGSDPLAIWYDGADVDLGRGGAVRHRHMGALDRDVAATGPFPTGYVTGTSMLVRAEVFGDVGPIPEEYFLYFEETDFNLRVRAAGWATVVEPRSRVHHFKRSTGALPTPEYVYYYVRNRLVFGRRFTAADTAEIEATLEEFLTGWRARVAENAPDWLPRFDALVRLALDDGRALRTGRRDLDALRRTT